MTVAISSDTPSPASPRANKRWSTTEKRLATASEALATAQERHWGRRDKPAIATASDRLALAKQEVTHAETGVDAAAEKLAEERTAMAARRAALEATAAERNNLSEPRLEIDDALAVTRPARVVAMAGAERLPEHLMAVLGPLPQTRGGRRTWCALAVGVEEERDVRATRPSTDRYSSWRYLASQSMVGREPYECARELIEMGSDLDRTPAGPVAVEDASSWPKQLDEARIQHEVLTHDPIDRTLGLELGL